MTTRPSSKLSAAPAISEPGKDEPKMPHRALPAPIDAARLANVAAAVEAIRQGKMVILVDDEDRENEGDLVLAADKVTPEAINFMAVHARGLICLALDEARRSAGA